jgi:hypothetical protein
MIRIQEIAKELCEGNIERASQIRFAGGALDGSIDVEIIEVARQAIIYHVKCGELDKACEIKRCFELPDDLAEDAIMHAVLSVYYERDFKRLVEIKKGMPLSQGLLSQIIEYCDSWGEREEAKAMRTVFLGQPA